MSYRTQRVTAVDLKHGRIRIPIGEKSLFPATRGRITVRLRGAMLASLAWDPRLGPDRERSGVIYVGAPLRDVVGADEVLSVSAIDGEVQLT